LTDLPSSLVELLELRASTQADDRSHILLSDRGTVEASLSFAELHHRAAVLAARLAMTGRPGDRALLIFPPGLDFVIGFFGCLLAGIVAVPLMVPRRQGARDASVSIAADCTPRFALTNAAFATGSRQDVIARLTEQSIEWIIVDGGDDVPKAGGGSFPRAQSNDIAFLQYTSGSTSEPKGVIVSHGNALHMLETIRTRFGCSKQSTCVGWLPAYHDMGLIGNVLHPICAGASCVLMAPAAFMTRPLTWIKAIHEHRGEITWMPNFAFDLCVRHIRPQQMEGIDLSSWRVAINGAEHIRDDTVRRFIAAFGPYGFAPRSMVTGYGLAEATLMVSTVECGAGHSTRTFSREAARGFRIVPPADAADTQIGVSCGSPFPGERIAIVDPDSCRRLGSMRVGEVWINGPNVCQGYWGKEVLSAATFRARIAGEGDTEWLRTGDLGFVDDTGDLFITGRSKELIIIRGMNHYPQDIEQTVQATHPALRTDGGAAFSVPDERLRQATRDLPVVFVEVSDPVAAGLVASLSRPGGDGTHRVPA
jgi:acyl-CoA synthetase (AMP-forming)/AMP-acid ligase II